MGLEPPVSTACGLEHMVCYQMFPETVLTDCVRARIVYHMMTGMFSFEDAVHNHRTFGIVEGCLACAQTMTDLALSRESMIANQPVMRPAYVRAA